MPELLRALELAGCIVTADALHCQKHIAREIIEADADYVLALKGNQGTAFAEIRTFLDDAIERKEPHLAYAQTVGKGHGRVEVAGERKARWFADKGAWEDLRSVGVVEARRTVGGKESVERRYYLSSLGSDAEKFARAVRAHWGVENRLHWVLDVVFGEDQSRAPHRPRRGEPRADPASGHQPPAAGHRLQTRNQRQAPPRRHRSRYLRSILKT